jgi:hypothetical protein
MTVVGGSGEVSEPIRVEIGVQVVGIVVESS